MRRSAASRPEGLRLAGLPASRGGAGSESPWPGTLTGRYRLRRSVNVPLRDTHSVGSMRLEVPWRTDVASVCCHADGPMVVRCPKCGSERLIPLTFGAALGTEEVDSRRPIAKCAACGERAYVTAKVHRSPKRD